MQFAYSKQLPLGWLAPDFSLEDQQGEIITLQTFKKCKGLVILFTCNHCKQSQQAWPIVVSLYEKFRENVCFLAINSDNEQAYPEDELEEMREVEIEQSISFPYLKDTTQEVTKNFKVQCLPECFVFKNRGNNRFSLFYHGRIVDNLVEPTAALDHALETALIRLTSDRDPQVLQKAAFGCGINWKASFGINVE